MKNFKDSDGRQLTDAEIQELCDMLRLPCVDERGEIYIVPTPKPEERRDIFLG